jgi:hypothetical protein
MGVPTFLQGAAATNQASGTPTSLQFSSNTKTGSLLVATIQFYAGGGHPTGGFSISDSQNNSGWTIIPSTAGIVNPDDLVSAFAFCLNTDGGTKDTISWGLGTGGSYIDISLAIAEYSNVSALRTSGSGTEAATTGTTMTSDSVSPHVGDLLIAWLGGYAPSTTGSLAAGGSYNLRETSTSGGANSRVSALSDFIATSASSQSATFSYPTNSGTIDYAAALIAFAPTASGGQGNSPLGHVIFTLDSGGFPILELQTGTNS